jgi:hypothetical protein
MVGMGICLNTIQEKTFLLLVIAISLAFAWILWPFYGAVLWATVLAIVFAPLYRRLSRSMRRHNLAAFATVVIIVVIVILPSTLITASLVQEAAGVYGKFQSGELNVARDFQRIVDALPTWVTSLLDRFGLTNLTEMQERLFAGLVKGSQFFATQALNIGQITFELIVRLFVMLYLLFFLLRDGDELFRTIKSAIPLRAEQQPRCLQQVRHGHSCDGQRHHRRGRRARSSRGPDLLVPRDPRSALMGRTDGLSISAARGGRRPGLATRRHLLGADRSHLAGTRSHRVRCMRHRPGGQSPASNSGRQRYQDASCAACLDAESISQTTRNIAAISGPKIKPFTPKISMPPSVDSNTK